MNATETIFTALAARFSFGFCRSCGEEDRLQGPDKLCRSCALDAEYQMSGEANPPAAPDTDPDSKCWRCGAPTAGDDPFCDLCYRPSAEDRYDDIAERGADDWKIEEGR